MNLRVRRPCPEPAHADRGGRGHNSALPLRWWRGRRRRSFRWASPPWASLSAAASVLLLTPKPERKARPSDGLAVVILWWLLTPLATAMPFVFGVANSSVITAIHEAAACLTNDRPLGDPCVERRVAREPDLLARGLAPPGLLFCHRDRCRRLRGGESRRTGRAPHRPLFPSRKQLFRCHAPDRRAGLADDRGRCPVGVRRPDRAGRRAGQGAR